MVRCVYECVSDFPPVADVVESLAKFLIRDAPFEEPETRESMQFAQQFYNIKGAEYKGQWSTLNSLPVSRHAQTPAHAQSADTGL